MEPFLARSMQFSANAQHRPLNATPLYNTSVFSSTGGPLHVSYPGYVYPVSAYGGKAFSSIGLSEIPGFTTGDLQGWGYWQFTMDPSTGLRSSSESSFLAEAMDRPGLTTYINSMARNIIFDNKTAVGVNITNYGVQPFTLAARKEVIVSAGVYNSPQLLMVSGIGPQETLDKFNIPVVVNSEGVGQNMWDSCAINGPVFEIDAVSFTSWQQPELMEQAIQTYINTTSGPLTNIGLDIGAYEKLPAAYRANLSSVTQATLAQFPSDWPEAEYMLEGVEALALSNINPNGSYATINCFITTTTSRGNMTIQSASNLDPPIINPNWLRSTVEQELAVQVFKRARLAWEAIPISIGPEVFPGPNVTTDAELLESIKKNLVPTHHGTASCELSY